MKDLSPVCFQWLQEKIPRLIHSMHVEGPHVGPNGAERHLHIVALDQPETDSHVKQLAAHVGELINHPAIYATKESQQGIHPWTIPNRSYDGHPAHPSAVLFSAQ